MLHCDRFRWIVLPLLTGAMLVTGHSVRADVIIQNGTLSIEVGSPDRDSFYSPAYGSSSYPVYEPIDRSNGYGRPTQIFTNRIENSTLINPVVIGAPIENSILINPVVVPPSRRTVRVAPAPSRPDPYINNPAAAGLTCMRFLSVLPTCW